MEENESIIIDGVDVSDCINRGKHNACLAKCGIVCDIFPSCHFKQLARKIQECESLSSQLDFEIQKRECLEQECEELKKQLIQKDEVNTFFNTPIEGWDNDPCKICESKQNYDQLKIDKAKLEAQIEADTQYHIKEECNLRNIIKNKEKRNAVLYKENNQLKTENETYKKMFDNPEVQIALTDIRTGERDLWQKYKPRMEQTEQKLERIREIVNIKQEQSVFVLPSVWEQILQIIDGE